MIIIIKHNLLLFFFFKKNNEIKFTDLYGLDEAINSLKASVIYPIQCPEDFIMFGISPPKGILVYGPPGVGKTSICSALAFETGFNLITIEVFLIFIIIIIK